jgi:ATP-dependent RNA helicase RhlE
MGFTKVGLSDAIMKAVAASGYTTPTEIQTRAIPLGIAGRDIIGCAPTGTGKTAAFVLPILQRLENVYLKEKQGAFIRALILTPTRELAQQIEDAIHIYGKFCSSKPVAIYGGIDINKQFRSLRQGADIVIATPGRLLDHLDRKSINLSHVQTLVIDEADRMFDMGFINAVRTIIKKIPDHRQTMLFSATMSREVRDLVASIQKHPTLIEIGLSGTPAKTVTQRFYAVPQAVKTNLLIHILQDKAIQTMLVFSRTKHGADRIARNLDRSGILSAAIHSNRSQSQRQRTLQAFKQRYVRVLVATDLAARGIDVDGISHVVNYDTPAFPEDYVHRIGRTGRASNTGIAMTFVSSDEKKYLRRIEQLVGCRCTVEPYPGFEHKVREEAPAPEALHKNAGLFMKRKHSFNKKRYRR